MTRNDQGFTPEQADAGASLGPLNWELMVGGSVGSAAEEAPADSSNHGLLGFGNLNTDLNTIGDQDPIRATITLDLDPSTLLAIQCVRDAFQQGLEVRIITQPDLVAAVDALLENADGKSPASQPRDDADGSLPALDWEVSSGENDGDPGGDVDVDVVGAIKRAAEREFDPTSSGNDGVCDGICDLTLRVIVDAVRDLLSADAERPSSHGSPSVGAAGVRPGTASEPIVGAAPGGDSFAAPGATQGADS